MLFTLGCLRCIYIFTYVVWWVFISAYQMLHRDKHIKYITSLDAQKGTLAYSMTAHLRMSGLYWGLTALHMLGAPDALEREAVIEFVLSCQHPNGGFGAHPNHDPHVLYTLSAVQILFLEDALDRIDADKVAQFVVELRREGGEFVGDKYGEVDTRFIYTAIQCLCILGKLDLISDTVDRTVEFLAACQNYDGGFGLRPGAESHAAQIFTVVAALDILGRLDSIDTENAASWLSERQVPEGGLNGRPEKLPDVCYSWWVLSSLAMLGHLNWIDGPKLREFILAAQDDESGGIADRKGDEPDVFHTIFGLAGLSLLGYENLEAIDPTFCLPKKLISKLPYWPGQDKRQPYS